MKVFGALLINLIFFTDITHSRDPQEPLEGLVYDALRNFYNVLDIKNYDKEKLQEIVTDDFLERQYFGKIAKRLRLNGMFMNDGNFVTTDVDEFDRFQSGSGSQEDAERQNNMGILPGKIAKKFNIKLKMKGAADDAMDTDTDMTPPSSTPPPSTPPSSPPSSPPSGGGGYGY